MAGASVAVAAIARLRRLAPALADGDDDQRWLATAIERYLKEASAGVNLDVTIGVAVAPGSSAWWSEERYAERDELLRALVSDFAGSAHSRAVALQQRLRRYAGTSWPRDRLSKQPSTMNAILFQIYNLDPDPPTGVRRLTEIISQ